MKDLFAFLFLWLISLTPLAGQAKTNTEGTDKKAEKSLILSPGGVYSAIQNTNFSTVNWYGLGGVLGLGFQKSTANYTWELMANIPFTPVSASAHDATGNIVNPSIHFTYLRQLNEKTVWGARWDIMDYYVYSQTDLGNNQTYNLQSSTLFASVRYETAYKNKPLHAGLHLGLLNFNREGFGFAFAAPQNVLEEGRFNYQDDAIDNPFGFKYYELDLLTSYLNVRTTLGLQFTKRSAIRYEWHLRHFSEVKGYPTTTAQHVLRYKFTFST